MATSIFFLNLFLLKLLAVLYRGTFLSNLKTMSFRIVVDHRPPGDFANVRQIVGVLRSVLVDWDSREYRRLREKTEAPAILRDILAEYDSWKNSPDYRRYTVNEVVQSLANLCFTCWIEDADIVKKVLILMDGLDDECGPPETKHGISSLFAEGNGSQEHAIHFRERSMTSEQKEVVNLIL